MLYRYVVYIYIFNIISYIDMAHSCYMYIYMQRCHLTRPRTQGWSESPATMLDSESALSRHVSIY